MSLIDRQGSASSSAGGARERRSPFPAFANVALVLLVLASIALAGCGGPSAEELAAVDYTPLALGDWPVSTPEEQGLDPALVAELYYNAEQLETLYGLLVIKNGYLVAEEYFHGQSVGQLSSRASVTKSITSALVGIALEQGCLTSVDQKMMEFFPELVDQIQDPRKMQITIREMLQMRAGYPWEESSQELFDLMFSGFRSRNLVDVPLVRDPGTGFDYSNMTTHLLGIIVARACDTDLKSYAQEYLFSPLGGEVGYWLLGWEDYYIGFAEMEITARDMAKFGQLYLDGGQFEGNQIVPANWVRDSLQTYSEDAWYYRVGKNWKDSAYGYQWWSIRAGDHRYNLAWGHGGQQIALLDELDLVVVATADPLYKQHGDQPWQLEKANLNLVADFIASLPGE
ncbi:MAG: serine hydrolase domain-containing protein [Anaerolineae bacterium]